jgi:VWFA-related protein
MPSLRALFCGMVLLSLFGIKASTAQAQQTSASTPTIRVTSRLVFLDVTVLDKKGNPVVKGLTKDDLTITDNKKPQRIFSFEAPETHIVDANATDDNPAGKAPVTIFVLDLLNSKFEDFAYIRYMVRKYMTAQPAQMNSPAELMVLGNNSLEMVQGYTRSKADLLYALDHVPAALPYKEMSGSFMWERFAQSIDALQQIALQNSGLPGRKNIVWVGHGGPNIFTVNLPSSDVDALHEYVHATTNMLVDSRMSLFVIYPGLPVNGPVITTSEMEAGIDIGDDTDPFSGDINFGVFVNETGGNLFYNRNDVNTEIKQSEEWGSEYYTLTYQPPEGNADGKFRRIRVTLHNPDLRVVTKAGYFSPDKKAAIGPRQQTMVELSEAVRSTIPFESLGVTIDNLVRHPDTRTAEFTVVLSPRNLDWQPGDDGKSSLDMSLAAASLSGNRDFLASRVESLRVTENSQDATGLARAETRLPVTIRIPRKTQSLRVVVQTPGTGRMGAVELDRKTIDRAPEAPTPEPKLIPQPQKRPAPVIPLRQ